MADAFDVIVVEARCAGSPTAMLLARSGYRVLVVDRSRLGLGCKLQPFHAAFDENAFGTEDARWLPATVTSGGDQHSG